MSRRTTKGCDLHQEVTDRIIAELEAGVPPWVQPWARAADAYETAVMAEEAALEAKWQAAA